MSFARLPHPPSSAASRAKPGVGSGAQQRRKWEDSLQTSGRAHRLGCPNEWAERVFGEGIVLEMPQMFRMGKNGNHGWRGMTQRQRRQTLAVGLRRAWLARCMAG